MNSGKLRHRIAIQTYTETVSDSGEPSRTWLTYADRWAAWKQIGGSELEMESEQIEGRLTHQFTIRKTSGVTQDMRVSYDSRIFNITGINADATDKRWQVLSCTEVGETV